MGKWYFVEFSKERAELVARLKVHGISEKVLRAMLNVPRHLFVPSVHMSSAYVDSPLNIGYGQTISAPHMVAIMCDLLDLQEGHKVLEVGAGSGYNAAVMAEIIGNTGIVYSTERIPELVRSSKNNLKAAGYRNVEVFLSDGSIGLPEHAPYDRICVTASAPSIPEPLVQQLRSGGRMVIPVGEMFQSLYLVTKENDGTVVTKEWGGVVFVPLIGKHGFHFEQKPYRHH
ncbi:MAG: Protein-L-isoaspartate O-methyltransferase [Methanomethylovorans sp. PtaU1.Bin093]|jgi:protein-L-isoaspartate(D-aspartate) O-methyltransferase|nr:protein-L-isoaspartate O-methyltransferase [Methanomethylovorans sp. PtaU1.Bin093]OPY20312.1 MAG: Protein-L-isoaspartate O-methyltransferase [Methanomethylovorans sp. PtaU1.Bin093]